MIVIRFGRWSYEATMMFGYTRIYWKGKWTAFCKVRARIGR